VIQALAANKDNIFHYTKRDHVNLEVEGANSIARAEMRLLDS
jgi:hypothetical protein